MIRNYDVEIDGQWVCVAVETRDIPPRAGEWFIIRAAAVLLPLLAVLSAMGCSAPVPADPQTPTPDPVPWSQWLEAARAVIEFLLANKSLWGG